MTTQEQEHLGPYRGSYRADVYKDDIPSEEATLEEGETEDEVMDDETISVSTEVKTEEHDYKKRYDDLKKHYDSKLHEWKMERETLLTQPQQQEEYEDDADIASFKENYPDVYNVVESLASKNATKEVQELKQEIERLSKKEEQLQAKSAYQELLALHPDFSDIKKSDQFKEWLGKQPPSIADGITKNNSDVQYASRVLDLYKADIASTKKPRGRPSKKQLAAAAEAVVNPDKTSSEEATEILSSLGKDVPKGTKGKIDAMKSLISDTFGVDASRYDNLKALNRAAVGFAIAKGDDIAAALEKGARDAAAIEQSRLSREDSMSKIALEQVFAEKLAGMRNAAAMAGKASDYTPERLRQRAIEAILRSPDQFDVYNPETNAVDPAKVQEQANILVQSMLQNDGGVDITTPTATGGAPVEVTTQEQYDALPSGTVFIQNGQKRKKP